MNKRAMNKVMSSLALAAISLGLLQSARAAVPGKWIDTENQPLDASWEDELGDGDTIALYGSFDWGHDLGGFQPEGSKDVKFNAQCGGGVDAGVIFRNKRKSVVKVASRGYVHPEHQSASTEMFAFGKSIWKSAKPGNMKPHSAKSEYDVASYPLIPGLLTARLSAFAQADVGIESGLSTDSARLVCTSNTRPYTKSVIGADVNLDIAGFKDASLGSVGVGGRVTVLDLGLPATGSIKQESKSKENEFKDVLKSDLSLSYLDGKIYISVATRIPLKGEKAWDWDKDTFKWTLFEWNGKKSVDELIDQSQTHKL